MIHTEDTRLLMFNCVMLLLTFTNLDILLKTLLVLVTLGFTIDKWVSHRLEIRAKRNNGKDS